MISSLERAGRARYTSALEQIKEVQKESAEKLKETEYSIETARAMVEEARSVRPGARMERCGAGVANESGRRAFPPPATRQRRDKVAELKERIASSEGDVATVQAQIERVDAVIAGLRNELESLSAVRNRTRHVARWLQPNFFARRSWCSAV